MVTRVDCVLHYITISLYKSSSEEYSNKILDTMEEENVDWYNDDDIDELMGEYKEVLHFERDTKEALNPFTDDEYGRHHLPEFHRRVHDFLLGELSKLHLAIAETQERIDDDDCCDFTYEPERLKCERWLAEDEYTLKELENKRTFVEAALMTIVSFEIKQ